MFGLFLVFVCALGKMDLKGKMSFKNLTKSGFQINGF